MTTQTFPHAHHSEDGGRSFSEIALLQLARVRDISAQAGTPEHTGMSQLAVLGYLGKVSNKNTTPLAASLGEQFTITTAGLAWLREHGLADNWQCPCRVCAGRG
jgi:hypothetical protein